MVKKVVRHYKIYALYNDITNDTYIGSTRLSLNERLSRHRSKSKQRDSKVYMKMREIGAHNFKIVELLSAHTDRIDAHKTECEFIEFFRQTLNSLITGKYVTPDGSYDKKSYKKAYYVDHRESILEKVKVYRNENRESILEKMKKYYIKNRESRIERAKEYYAKIKIE